MWATHLHLMTITNREINLKSLGGFVYPSPLLYNRFLRGIRMGYLKIVEKGRTAAVKSRKLQYNKSRTCGAVPRRIRENFMRILVKKFMKLHKILQNAIK